MFLILLIIHGIFNIQSLFNLLLVPLSEIQMLESQLLKHLPVCKGIVQQCTTTPY